VDTITVLQTRDGLRAFLLIPEVEGESYPDADALLSVIKDHGIEYGIDLEAIESMCHQKITGKHVLVAEGKSAVDGVPGELKVLVDFSQQGKPKTKQNGRVDQKDLSFSINVHKGDPLIERIPPIAGTDGVTVFGKVIEALQPPPVVLKTASGTMISPDNENLLIAACDGAVRRIGKNMVVVDNIRHIWTDVDYSTGNIFFEGNIQINGTVRAGFSVSATGNISVHGEVEDSFIDAGGSIEITRGVSGGGKGKLLAGKNITVKHLENFNAEAQNDIAILDDAIQCSIYAEGIVSARSLIGGKTFAGDGIFVEFAGNAAEVKTVIELKGKHSLLEKREKAVDELAKLIHERTRMKEKIYILVKNAMDDVGSIDNADRIKLERLKKEKQTIIEKRTAVEENIVQIDKELEKIPRPTCHIGTVYPNTHITSGKMKREIDEEMRDILLTIQEDQITIEHTPFLKRKLKEKSV